MLDPGVKARETADCETPASAATSNEVARDLLRLFDMASRSKGYRLLRIQSSFSRLGATLQWQKAAPSLAQHQSVYRPIGPSLGHRLPPSDAIDSLLWMRNHCMR